MIAPHPSPQPFWTFKDIHIDISLSEKIDKKNTNPVLMKSLTDNHLREKYHNHNHIYTDASKFENKVGIGIYLEKSNIKQAFRLNDNLSITTGELIAIKKVLEIILDNPDAEKIQICLCTDSLGACQALQSGNVKYVSRPDLLVEIILLHENIIKSDMKVKIVWIPSHVNIAGNEIADQCANEGRSKETIDFDCKLGYSEIVSLVNSRINNLVYQNQYSNSMHPTVIKFRKTFPTIKCNIKLDNHFYLLNRVRARATRINMFNEEIYCRVCRQRLSLKHAIKYCTLFTKQRVIVVNTMKQENLQLKLKNIGRTNLRNDTNCAVMTLLKNINDVFKI